MQVRSASDGQGAVLPRDDCRWRLSAGADLAPRAWGGEYVVHHALSNDTYRLTELAGQLLLALNVCGTVDVPSLAHELGADISEVADTLDVLLQMNLVVRC